jgi:uncharacterized protein YkwD
MSKLGDLKDRVLDWLDGFRGRFEDPPRLRRPPTPRPPAPPPPTPAGPTDFELNADMLRRFNLQRAGNGVPRPLALSGIPAYMAALTQATDLDARKEADPKRFHAGSDGSDEATRLRRFGEVNWTAAAEIAAMAPDADSAVRLWMNSPPHRADILGDFDEMACARSGMFWICTFLRRPR